MPQYLPISIIIWIIGAILVGLAGLNRWGGFFKAFLLAIVLTPLPAIILVIASRVKNPIGCSHCGNKLNEAEVCLVCGHPVSEVETWYHEKA